MRLLTEAVTSKPAGRGSAVDVGAGTSTLADELLAAGWSPVTVLDVSVAALEQTRARLGDAADVRYVVSDILEWQPDDTFDAWHDRAVFHFLTRDEQRASYVRQVVHALKPGGYAIVGSFGPQGPTQCSGLPVARYAPDELHGQFGARFRLVQSSFDVHKTPWGSDQQFVYCFCRLEH